MDDNIETEYTELPDDETDISVESETETEAEDGGINIGELFSLLDTYKNVVGEIKTDNRAQLIKAVRPFLSVERQSRADNCLKILSITRFMEHKEEFSKVGGKFIPV